MEKISTGRAMSMEFGEDPDGATGGTLAYLIDSESEESKIDYARIDPFFAQLALDFWRHQLQEVSGVHEMLRKAATGEIVRVVELKITRILDAFGGKEPDSALHKLLLNKDYCNRVHTAAFGLHEFPVSGKD